MSNPIENQMTAHQPVRHPHGPEHAGVARDGCEDFDRSIHARYADATTHVSARTHAQLRLRLRAAMATTGVATSRTATARPAVWLATVCSMALLVVAGVQWHAGREAAAPASTEPASTQFASLDPAPRSASMTEPVSTESGRVASSPTDAGELVATLDETPDLYLWLASDEANALATE